MTKLESNYWRMCFVVMPYGTRKLAKRQLVDFDEIYREIFQKAIKRVKVDDETSLLSKRGDDASQSALLIHGMIQDLCRSRLMLADLSADNINVGLEVGLRYSLVPTGNILVRLKGTSIPFDFTATRVTQYSDAPPSEVPNARKHIADVIRETLKHNDVDNPYYYYGRRLASEMGPPENPTDLGIVMVQAEQAVARQDIKAAIDKYAEAEKIEPKLAPLHVRRAALLTQGDYMEEARVEIRKAIKLNPAFLKTRGWWDEITRGKLPKPVFGDQRHLVIDSKKSKRPAPVNRYMLPFQPVPIDKPKLKNLVARKRSARINNSDKLLESFEPDEIKGGKAARIRSGRGGRFRPGGFGASR